VAQVLRIVALGVSVLAWLVLTLIVLPLIEGEGSSSLLELAITSAFLVWLIWAAAAIRYDRRARRVA
jgi:hypothetical protein